MLMQRSKHSLGIDQNPRVSSNIYSMLVWNTMPYIAREMSTDRNTLRSTTAVVLREKSSISHKPNIFVKTRTRRRFTTARQISGRGVVIHRGNQTAVTLLRQTPPPLQTNRSLTGYMCLQYSAEQYRNG